MDRTDQLIQQSSISSITTHRYKNLTGILLLLVIISLACSTTAKPATPTKPGAPAGFLNSDCNAAGLIFSTISTNYTVDDMYDGPSLTCLESGQGAHGSVTYYIGIFSYKTAPLAVAYSDLLVNIQGFEDQALAWNASPNVPAEAKQEISYIYKSLDRYVIVISGQANVQKCLRGDGYGVERLYGKYLVHLSFDSCEQADAEAYSAEMKSLETAALTAILRVEGNTSP